MANILKRVVNAIFTGKEKAAVGGNVLQTTSNVSLIEPTAVVNTDYVNAKQPFGTAVPTMLRGRASGWAQTQNLSTQLDITKVQAAVRAAERGDTTLLFAYYRDLFISTGIVSTELQKRKLAVLSEPFSIIPVDKKNPEDVKAAEAIEVMIANCPNWRESLIHLMNAILFPVALAEKKFRPVEAGEDNPLALRYFLDKLYPVDYILVNYRLPYLPQGPIGTYSNMPPVPGVGNMAQPWFYTGIQSSTGRPEDTIYDLDSWEPNLRLWHVFNNGLVDYSWSNIYAPDPFRHIVYRCNLLNGVARDNFGGNGRAVLFWAIMAQQGRETFMKLLNRYGVPFMVGRVNSADVGTVAKLQEAFDTANILGSLIVNKDAIVEIQAMNLDGAVDGNEKFLNFCNDQISLLICGNTLASHATATGMGSGVANLQGQVRDDIISFDRLCLCDVLRTQLFSQFLKINGIKGRAPNITWGGASEINSKDLAITVYQFSQAGIYPTQDAMEVLSQKVGFQMEYRMVNDASGSVVGQKPNGNKNNSDNSAVPSIDDEEAEVKETETIDA